jgi:hypothetical protein
MQKVQTPVIVFCLVLLCSVLCPGKAGARTRGAEYFEDRTFSHNIKTVQFHVRGWEMSYPVIELGSNEELAFSFDDMDGDIKNYQYTVIHCNADWTRSTLLPSDYIEGFPENPLDNHRLSFNTFVSYTHYSLIIPDFDLVIRLPGNYALVVYDSFDRKNVVLTRRFMVSESSVMIRAHIHQPRNVALHRTSQQVSFSIVHPDITIRDPHSELHVSVMQNGRTDKAITDLKPLYIRNMEVVYEDDERLVFQGGNEFRNFDTKNLRYQTEFIRRIDFSGGMYHVELHPSRSREYARYFSHQDINGRYLVRNEQGRNPSVDADYVMVYFTLPWKEPFDNGNVYVIGALSDWQFYGMNQMTYNLSSRSYELTMLLKQGYYNYHYAFLQEGQETGDAAIFEGTFFETENEYLIAVYHRPPGSRFDRLVGTLQLNSRGPSAPRPGLF